MNLKTWLPLGAAVIMGVIAVLVGRNMMSRPAPRVVPAKLTSIVVTRDNVAAGTQLKASDLALAQYPEANQPPGVFAKLDDVAGRVTTIGLVKGQPVMENLLAPPGSASGLPAIVPDGMRAVTMEVNEFSGVAGLLIPGCRVDVVTTLTADAGSNSPMMTRTIASNLQVIAVGRRFGNVQIEPDAPAARSVTLLAVPREAEAIDLCAHLGNPRLVLRGSRESHNEASDGVTLGELRTGTREPGPISRMLANLFNPLKAPAAAAGPASPVAQANAPAATKPADKNYRDVQVIRAGKQETAKVENAPDLKQPTFVNTDNAPAVPGTTDGPDGH